MKSLLLLTVCLVLIVLTPVLSAQGTAGSIVGTVTDATGANIPNVRVELVNAATGVRLSAVSDVSGQYRIGNVPPGRYRFTTTLNSRTTTPSQEVEITTGNVSTINVSFADAGKSLTDTVTEAKIAPDTTLSTEPVRASFNTRYLHYLPQPSLITPMVAQASTYNLTLLPGGIVSTPNGPSVNGQRGNNSNNFLLDGIDNNNKVNPGPLVYVSNEATTELLVTQNSISPEFGHAVGGQFNGVIRSGTNQFHGAIYDFLQNRNMNAIDRRVLAAGFTDNPKYDQNRLGASFGTPIIKNKLFLFGNFEWIPTSFDNVYNGVAYVPTAAGFTTLGALSGVSQTNLGVLRQSVTPATTASRAALVNGVSIPLGVGFNATRTTQDQYVGTGAVDWTITPKDQLRGRYVHNDIRSNNSGAALGAFTTPTNSINLLASAAWYHTFDKVTNELRFGYNRFDQDYPGGNFTFPGLSAFPNITVSQDLNLTLGPNYGIASRSKINTYHLSESANLTFGSHSVRVGFDGRRYLGGQSGFATANGIYGYSTLSRFLLDLPPDVVSQRSFGNSFFGNNQWDLFAFVNDTWRVNQHLTVEAGLRYNYVTIPQGNQYDPFTQLSDLNNYLTSGPHSQTTLFSPRFGIAYSPGDTQRGVFRAGFGINYDTLYAYNLLSPGTLLSGNTLSSTAGFLRNGGIAAPAGLTAASPTPQQLAGLGTSYYPDQKLPYTMQWNAAYQQSFYRNFTGEIKYVGARSINLPMYSQLNAAPGITASNSLPVYYTQPAQAQLNALPLTLNQLAAQQVTPGAGAGLVNPINSILPVGRSTYHALVAQLNHRFTGGFQMLGSYTYSHLSDSGEYLPPGTSIPSLWGDSAYDRRHRGTATAFWEPSPLFKNSYGVVRNVLANVTLSGTYTFQSGAPISAYSGLGSGLGGFAANNFAVFNPNGATGVSGTLSPLTNSAGQTVAYLSSNPNAQFLAGAPGVYGNAPRNALRMGDVHNFDVAVVKRFSYADLFSIELRGEAYNVLNRTNYTIDPVNSLQTRSASGVANFLVPGTDFLNFGNYLSSNPRMLQVALRFAW